MPGIGRLQSQDLGCTEASRLGSPANFDFESGSAGLCWRIHTGDKQAEAQLYRAALPLLLSYLARRQIDDAEAEDIAHDTILSVLTKLRQGTLLFPSQLMRYLYRTANNLCSARQRRAFVARRCETTDIYDLADTECVQTDTIAKNEVKRRVYAMLALLSRERDRQVLIQRYLLEKTKAEICDNLGLSPAKFDRVAYNARKRLANALAKSGTPR